MPYFSEINQSQQNALRNQQAFDQQAWKTAFDIASNFNRLSDGYTTMADNRRKAQENFDTSAWRVKATNAENQRKFDTAPWLTQSDIAKARQVIDTADSTIGAKNAQNNAIIATEPQHAQAVNAQYATTIATEPNHAKALNAQYAYNTTSSNINRQNAQEQYNFERWVGQNATVDPVTGRFYTPQERAIIATQEGQYKTAPRAFEQLVAPAQQFAQQEAYRIALYSPEQASNLLSDTGQITYTVEDGDDAVAIRNQEGIPVGSVKNEEDKVRFIQSAVPQPKTTNSRYGSNALENSEFIWGERRDAESRKIFQASISKIEQALRTGGIEGESGRYILKNSDGTVNSENVDNFLKLVNSEKRAAPHLAPLFDEYIIQVFSENKIPFKFTTQQ